MTSPASNPLLLAYYGDDFTGSADVMEVLQWSGLKTALFVNPPSPDQLQRFPGLRAFGIAGSSRAMSPTTMERELPPAFEALSASGAPFIHYKICSTFDSSPDTGSIGKAIDIGRSIFNATCIPILAGAPNLGRYTVFGNLFARSGLDSEPYRLDRHPTMRHHPVTPMNESDLRLILQRQTQTPVELFNLLQLESLASGNNFKETVARWKDGVLFDVLSSAHLPIIGQLLQELSLQQPRVFLVGSSGMEYALTAHWKRSGQLKAWQNRPAGQPAFPPAKDPLVILTGSCSPVNGRQINHAAKNGFLSHGIDTPSLMNDREHARETERMVKLGAGALREGKSVILHSCLGPEDPRFHRTRQALQTRPTDGSIVLGKRLGTILGRILELHPVRRAAVAGGDTSGTIARTLGIEAIEAVAPVAPGSPLCRIHSSNHLLGTEMFFKGGQVGKDNVWSTLLNGTEKQ